jgi:hypothetical protein
MTAELASRIPELNFGVLASFLKHHFLLELGRAVLAHKPGRQAGFVGRGTLIQLQPNNVVRCVTEALW